MGRMERSHLHRYLTTRMFVSFFASLQRIDEFMNFIDLDSGLCERHRTIQQRNNACGKPCSGAKVIFFLWSNLPSSAYVRSGSCTGE